MNRKLRHIAVAVSGGSDSLLALALLKEQGLAAMALHAHFLPPDSESKRRVEALADMCQGLGVAFHDIDLHERFEAEVIRPFVDGYAGGFTPNPCAHCNPLMKFGALMDEAERLGAGGLATGHYANIVEHPEFGPMLARGADPAKDQSYFLSLVPRERLERAVFPLGGAFKKDVPGLLAQRGLTPPLPAESQEVCFVPGDDYRAFLTARGIDANQQGPILKDGEQIGRHQGLWRYTLGQRRGIGVSWPEPLYVIGKDMRSKALITGTARELEAHGCLVGQVNLLAQFATWPDALTAQTRYRQKAKPVAASLESGRLRLSFKTPQSLPTPGQIAAVYGPGGLVLAGGVIQS